MLPGQLIATTSAEAVELCDALAKHASDLIVIGSLTEGNETRSFYYARARATMDILFKLEVPTNMYFVRESLRCWMISAQRQVRAQRELFGCRRV